MESPFHKVHSGPWQSEASDLDRWFERRADWDWYARPCTLYQSLLHASETADLCNAKRNWNKTPGYTEAETTAYRNILNPPESEADVPKFIDVWRKLHPEDKHFTYFSYRFNCRQKGIGWRLDMCKRSQSLCVEACSSPILISVVLSERLVDRVKMVRHIITQNHGALILRSAVRDS